jgi:predicted ester cyclase
MGIRENAQLVERYLLGAWDKGDLTVVDETCAPDVSLFLSGNPEGYRGTEAVKRLIAFVRGVFPDLFLRIEDTVAEDDRVAARWSTGGTQRGEWERGIPPTGRRVTWTGMSMYRLRNGRIVEERFEEDLRGVGLQTGVLVETTRDPHAAPRDRPGDRPPD